MNNIINNEEVPIIEEGKNGHWVRYEDHKGNLIKREWVSDLPHQETDIFNEIDMKVVIQSVFAKANVNVWEGDIATIKNEGKVDFSPTDKTRKIYNFEIELSNGEKKTASFNNASLKNLIEAFGDDSKTWVEKKIKASIVKVQAFGKVVDSIIWYPVEEGEK